MSTEPEKQKPDLEQQLEAEKKRSEEYLTRLKYLQADFENLKKRTERQIAEIKEYSTERLIIELLNVVDELELALKTAQKSDSAKALIEGVQMTLKKLKKILECEGVSQIDCVGKAFDPTRHNAIGTIESSEVDGCVVAEEVRKGYIMKNKVIRPSIVRVKVNTSKSQGEQ
ncbi:MAG: nucleotide exchange factor GrpE [Candidatus Bathyarchaeia archaeon]